MLELLIQKHDAAEKNCYKGSIIEFHFENRQIYISLSPQFLPFSFFHSSPQLHNLLPCFAEYTLVHSLSRFSVTWLDIKLLGYTFSQETTARTNYGQILILHKFLNHLMQQLYAFQFNWKLYLSGIPYNDNYDSRS